MLFTGIIPVSAQYRRRPIQKIQSITINEFTAGIGLSKINVPYSHYLAGFSVLRGVQINGFSTMALGAGISFYNKGYLLPLFVDFRYNYYSHKRYSAYFFDDSGLLISISPDFKYSKLFINPGVGIEYYLNRYFSANIGLGLPIQQGPTRDSFINLKLGIIHLSK